MQDKKVIIIGSGIGGLSTAIILAKSGYQVTVLEKNKQPGGMMRSYRRRGIHCETGIHYLGSLDRGQILRKFFDYLEVTEDIPVTRMGEDGVIDRYIFPDQTEKYACFDLPPSIEAYAGNLLASFPDEHKLIDKIVTSLADSADQLHSLEYLYKDNQDFSLLDDIEPMGAILHKYRCSPELKSVLAIPSSWIGVPIDECPAYYHNMALASYLSSSWRLKKNGSHMVDALANRLEKLGGTIITAAKVEKVLVESREVKGVETGNGDKMYAANVIAAIHPQQLLPMLPDGAVKPSYKNRISRIKNTHSVFALHASIDGKTHPPIKHNIFAISTEPTGEVNDLNYYQFRKSGKKGTTLLSIITSGREELWHEWQESTTGKRGDDYLKLKKQQAAILIKEAENLFGPFNDLKILDTFTPLTIRDWVNSPDGSAYGVLRSANQVLSTALLNRTAVKGLCLAGQNILAPGVIGTIMGSFSTAKLIMGEKRFKEEINL